MAIPTIKIDNSKIMVQSSDIDIFCNYEGFGIIHNGLSYCFAVNSYQEIYGKIFTIADKPDYNDPLNIINTMFSEKKDKTFTEMQQFLDSMLSPSFDMKLFTRNELVAEGGNNIITYDRIRL